MCPAQPDGSRSFRLRRNTKAPIFYLITPIFSIEV